MLPDSATGGIPSSSPLGIRTPSKAEDDVPYIAWIARTDTSARDAEIQRVLRETEALLITTGAGEQRREGL